jgi:dephospho-CoA kinase
MIARSELAKLVFGPDPASRQRLEFLESHSHPEITRAVERELASAETSGVVAAILDAAVMFKAGWDLWCDHLIFVDCRSEIRWERVRTRGWTFEQFTAREALQLPLEEKRRRADAVIVNEPDFQRSVEEQAKELWTRWGLPIPPESSPAMGESRSTNVTEP